MRKLLVLGGGTAGTIVLNKLIKKLPKDKWEITVVDQDSKHIYQPGLLFLPFGTYEPEQIIKKRQAYFPKGISYIQAEIEKVDPQLNKVYLKDSRELDYDYLVIASGTTPRPDQTPGMSDPKLWYKSVFDFFTLEGSIALRDALKNFNGGRLVVHITEMPIKCPQRQALP